MTRAFAVTAAPQDVVQALGLMVGMSYTIEVVRGSVAVRLWEGPAAPADPSYFHTVAPGSRGDITPIAGEGVWLWTARGDRGRVVVTDAP